MRVQTMRIIAVCLFLSPSNSYAQACADGRQVTITGTLAKEKALSEAQKKIQGGSTPGVAYIDVANSAPCRIDILEIKGAAPAGCVGGASFKASGRAQDVYETFLNVTSISCR